MTDWTELSVRTKGDSKGPEWKEPLLTEMPEDSLRDKKKHPVSGKSEKPQKSRESSLASRQPEVERDEQVSVMKDTEESLPVQEKPLQENTISRSSLKLEEAHRSQVPSQRAEDGKDSLKKEKSKHHQDRAGSTPSETPFKEEEERQESLSGGRESAMDFSECNGHGVQHLRPEPVADAIKLEREEEQCLARAGNKTVTSQQARKKLIRSETDSTAAEEKAGRRRGSCSKVEAEHKEDHTQQEESPGNRGKVRACEREEKRRRKAARGGREEEEEDEGIAERRKSLKKTEEEEEERESEVEKEEMARRRRREEEEGHEGGAAFEIKVECNAEERKLAKRKKGKAEEAPEDGSCAEGKPKKGRSKGAAKKEEAKGGSRKRKAKEEADEGGKRRKKPKKEESGKEKAAVPEDKWKCPDRISNFVTFASKRFCALHKHVKLQNSRWEEEKREDGVKWQHLEHQGPYFAPPYEPLPDGVNFYYNGKPMKLSLATEEIATFYAKMLDHEYTTKEAFQNNFFNDWTKEMIDKERKEIKCLEKCDFREIHKYFVEKHEAQKALPKEEKEKLKEESAKIQEEYGYCIIDGHREKIGNFKTEPPGLFRGRGDHPKMGMLKKRIMPEDVIINCSKDSKIPEPPSGHRWKEVRCDNTVTWLASWTENIQGSLKYIMLNPSSKLKGEKDWQKYEVARCLKGVVHRIRRQYQADWKSKEMKKRQRSVALYFIDKLALRAGNEKEEGETADTVGCCSLRIEHIKLHPELDGKENVVEFDFLGKDSIRYYNRVPVEKQVFKNLHLFMENKDPGDDLFDRLSTASLNKHLQDLMDGLTAKVFRTYNASITLQEQLKALTNEEDTVAAKLLSYNRANRAVAILCNHQRATPKTFEKSMQNLQAKIDAKKDQLADAKVELKRAKADHKARKDVKSKAIVEKKNKLIEKIKEQLAKLDMQATDKEENKQIALGTSKLNYLDPRISVAWCKKFGVPIEKIYNKTQREKFAWAIAMADEDFEF